MRHKWKKVKVKVKVKSLSRVPCPTLCNPMDCSLPGSSVHRILQVRIPEWVAISFSRGSSWPRARTQVSRIGGRRYNLWATREDMRHKQQLNKILCKHRIWKDLDKSNFLVRSMYKVLSRVKKSSLTSNKCRKIKVSYWWTAFDNLFSRHKRYIRVLRKTYPFSVFILWS